jgi:two-component system, cell cycle sensor histidine kinase and response regulator CckA
MTVSIGILLAGAPDGDAGGILAALRQAGFDPTIIEAADRESFLAALDHGRVDAVLYDVRMPRFCCDAALTQMKVRGLDLPFVVLADSFDEVQTVGFLKAGAHDVVSTARLERLPLVLMRELEDAKDRSERRVTDEALRRNEDHFRQSQKMEAIGQLAGGVAHDFNNLLTAILGYTALLLESARDQPEMVEDLREVQKAGERAGSLTRQLLTFSRKQALQPVTLNLNEVIAELEKMLRRLIGDDIRFETIKEPALHHINVDPNQIEQILMNLAVNARDAMPHGGVLTIQTKNEMMQVDPRNPTTAARWPCVTLVVADTGSGIPAEILDRIFEPFFTTKGPGKGTGLGLSTVYGVVTQSGGVITVDSKPKRGTSFSIRFPAIDVPVEAVGPTARQAAGRSASETILLVEDEPGVRHLVQRVLTGRGYAVLEARDVAHAAAIATDHPGPIHLLLTDIVMPGLSGPDLAQRIVAQRPDVRVLYMSGFANRLNTHHGSLSAGVTILRKPFTPEHLVRTIRDCLDVAVS